MYETKPFPNRSWDFMKKKKDQGNPLFPFPANLFISILKTAIMKELQCFLWLWLRYVDDILYFRCISHKNVKYPRFHVTVFL